MGRQMRHLFVHAFYILPRIFFHSFYFHSFYATLMQNCLAVLLFSQFSCYFNAEFFSSPFIFIVFMLCFCKECEFNIPHKNICLALKNYMTETSEQ